MRCPVICVNFNNSECSIGLIKSLMPQWEYVHSIIVVDNASEIAEIDELRTFVDELGPEYKERIRLHRMKMNIGYFPALNEGLQLVEDPVDYVIIGNNDLVFAGNFLAELVQMRVESDVFVICPDVVTISGLHQNPHVVRPMSVVRKAVLWTYFSNYFLGVTVRYLKQRFLPRKAPFVPGQFDIHMGIGACYVLTDNFLKKVERLHAPVFLYGEEAFLSNQVKTNGGRLIYCSSLRVVHLESVTTAKIPAREKYRMTQESFRLYRDYL